MSKNNTFKIKNIDFLEHLNYIDKTKDIEVYRFIENLIYNELSSEKIHKLQKESKELGSQKFIDNLKLIIPKNVEKENTFKRKNIKENMIENYVIKQNKNQKYFNDLNVKILLKTIPNKNITIHNGDIVSIKFD